VEVARGQTLYRQTFERGRPVTKLETIGKAPNRRGTKVRFLPDEQIFGKGAHFDPARVFKMARAKAYLFGGVEIPLALRPCFRRRQGPGRSGVPLSGGLKDYLALDIEGQELVIDQAVLRQDRQARRSWLARMGDRLAGGEDGFVHSYCNTIPTPDGGTHETGLRIALLRALKDHAERVGQASGPPRSPPTT